MPSIDAANQDGSPFVDLPFIQLEGETLKASKDGQPNFRLKQSPEHTSAAARRREAEERRQEMEQLAALNARYIEESKNEGQRKQERFAAARRQQ